MNRQDVLINAKLWFDTRQPSHSHNFEETINYRIAQSVGLSIEQKRKFLQIDHEVGTSNAWQQYQ